ncbi:MAG: ChaN family lipoprotein [Magnetococcales bacterium]|nr:ChaN family lipoprotein [Magnetococcales bacterium]
MGILGFLTLFIVLQVLGMGGMTVEPGEIFRLGVHADGNRLEQPVLMDALARQRIILVGETHDDPEHHAVQKHVIAAMADRGGELAVAMEMFPRSMQPVLDQWSAGTLNEDEFLDQTSWYFTWGFDADLYLPILRLAKERHIPLLAMNIDRTIVSQVRMRGLESLEASIRKNLPPLAQPLPEYRRRLQEVFHSHPMMAAAGTVDYFIDAQRVWDGVMAQAIADWSHRHPYGRVVGLAGSGHLLMKHGIPHQLAAMGLQDDTVVLLPWDGQDNPISYQASDFVWGTPHPVPTKPLSRMGVALEAASASSQGEGGAAIVITEVTPGSPGERAGLKVGDQPIRLDQQPLPKPHTLVRLLRSPSRNPKPVLTFIRNHQEHRVIIDLDGQSIKG